MIDLERTERFMLLREAKNLFFAGQIESARQQFERYLVLAPNNLIARYYVGRCHVLRRRHRQAARAFAEMIRLASRRRPPLHLPRVRRELEKLRQHHLGWWMRWRLAGLGTHLSAELSPDEAMRRDVSRAMHHLWRRGARKQLPGTRESLSG
jgi:tetratricopeptide (TPR) repeat protein